MDAATQLAGSSREALLAAVEAALDAELRPAGAPERARLAAAARHLALAGEAKRARPALCFSLASAIGARDLAALVDAAVGIELVHTASLLHDDIVDGDVLRRGRPTINARDGNAVAVLTGDFVLARALGRLRPWPALLGRAIEVLEQMTVAALVEIEARGDAHFDERRWRAMAEGKTGVLFGLCGAAAAHAMGDGVRAERFFAAGVHLGVAFQIADDVDDLAGGDDLREGNPSFPVVAAAARSERVRVLLHEAWPARGRAPQPAPAPSLVTSLVREVIGAGGLTLALDAARIEVEHAREAFGLDGQHAAIAAVLDWADALVEGAAREAR